MSPQIKTQLKIIGIILGIALIAFNVYFFIQLGSVKKQVNTNTDNVGKIVNFINQSINAQKDN